MEDNTNVDDVKVLEPKIMPQEPQAGLIIIPSHAHKIWLGTKSLIVKPIKLEYIQVPLWLLGGKLCYGKIQLDNPIEISSKEDFNKLYNEHRISEDEKKKWGKRQKEWKSYPLYGYKMNILEKFSSPRPVKYPRGVKVFVKKENIQFLDIGKMSGVQLETWHAIAHKKGLAGLQYQFMREFGLRGIFHPYKDHLDRIPEFEALIRDWKTYNPLELIKTERGKRILLDDHRLIHIYWKRLKRGKPLKSLQFKKHSLPEQKKIIIALHAKIVEAIKELGWQHKSPMLSEDSSLPEGMVIEDIDVGYVKGLSNKQLLDLDKYLHDKVKEDDKVTEGVHDAHVFIGIEMKKRGLLDKHEKKDVLWEATKLEIAEYPTPQGLTGKDWDTIKKTGKITMEDVWNALPDEVTVPKPYFYTIGKVVNEKSIPLDHDIDLLLKDTKIDPEVINAFGEKLPTWLFKRIHWVPDIKGPDIGHSLPSYRRVYRKIAKLEVLSKDIVPGKAYVSMKPRSGFKSNEFWDVNLLWTKWAASRIDEGLIIQKKYDGRRFSIHYDKSKGIFKMVTEDRQRDRKIALPYLAKKLESFLSTRCKSVVMDVETVVYDCPQEILDKEDKCNFIAREDTAFLTVGETTEDQQKRVVCHAHELVYLNGKQVHQLGYRDRFNLLTKMIGKGTPYLGVVKSKEVKNLRDFTSTVNKLKQYPSEGIIAKTFNGAYKVKYSGESRTGSMAKLKNLKELEVMVWEVVPKKTKEGKELNQWVYIAVFKVPCSMKNKFRDLIEWKDQCYVKIGRTYGTKIKCKRGDIITIATIRIEKTEDKGKEVFTWMFPYVVEKKPGKTTPDSLTVVERIMKVKTGPLSRKLSHDESLSDTRVLELTKIPTVITLEDCPYYRDNDLCPFKRRFKLLNNHSLSKTIKMQILKHPINCPFANRFVCKYVKDYYYPFIKIIGKEGNVIVK